MAGVYHGFSDRIIGSGKFGLCCKRKPSVEATSVECHSPDKTNDDRRFQVNGNENVSSAHFIPSKDELNELFKELVDELGLHGKQKEAMFFLSDEKKWQIYCSKQKEPQVSSTTLLTPEKYISILNLFRKVPSVDDRAIDERTDMMKSLKMALRTQPVSFLLRFLEMGGLDSLLNFLREMDAVCRQKPIHTLIVACIQNIMNDTEGRTHVLVHPNAISIVAESLITTNVRTKIAVLELLGATCLVPGGHRKVLQAMTQLQKFTKERTRFQSVIVDLDTNMEDYRLNVGLKTAIMSFLNALIRCGPGQLHLEFRLHLRYELLMLGITSTIEDLRLMNNDTLDRHLDFFEMVRASDEKEFAKRFQVNHVDSKSAIFMFDLLRKRLGFGLAYQHFLSIFFHLLQLPTTGTRIVQYWQLVDRIIQQVVLQTQNGDADFAPLQIDVKKLISQLTIEASFKETQQKMREIEKLNNDLTTKLIKKERECDIKMQEKDELMQTLHKLNARFEKEVSNYHNQMSYLTSKISDLERLLESNTENPSAVNLQLTSHEGSRFSSVSPKENSPTELEEKDISILTPLPLTVDPLPPPPPPLPPLAGLNIRSKSIPESSQPLKSFNWTKLSDNKIEGTIWKDIDDARAFKFLDLEDLEKHFSAYQRRNDGGAEGKEKVKELTVIDGRRAQNCTIMLSKLKMTNSELKNVILSVDQEDDLPKDICEQLLKFVPTAEEVQMLLEHSMELNQMARADHFLFEMSRIDHYEERLRALFFKKSFSERMLSSNPRIKDVLEASKEVIASKRLREVLEIVLAFGNYMNRGQRGNAFGFKMSSLNKIVDTKSSVNKKATLLHYLAEVLEKKDIRLLNLEEEMGHVKGAAKVKLTDLEAKIVALRFGINEIEKELNYQKLQTVKAQERDAFIAIMSDFHQIATCRFADMEFDFREMKDKFQRCVEIMGEESKKIESDEFFGIFDQFLNSLSEARNDNKLWIKQKHEDERKARREEEIRTEKEKLKTRSDSNIQHDKTGEMDELIFALKSLEVFRDDVKRMKRSKNRHGSQILSPTGVVSTTDNTASSKNNRKPLSASSQDKIFIIS